MMTSYGNALNGKSFSEEMLPFLHKVKETKTVRAKENRTGMKEQRYDDQDLNQLHLYKDKVEKLAIVYRLNTIFE